MFNITLNNNCNILNIKASTTIYWGMYINIIIIIIWHVDLTMLDCQRV